MMQRNTVRTLLTLGLALILLAACGGSEATGPDSAETPPPTTSDDVFRIVATTTQASDLARILTDGVPGVEVTGLMGAGVDPHLYQPTESDIAAMNSADMVVYSGLFLEGQFDTVFDALGQQGVRVHAMSDPVKNAGFTIGGFTLSDELVDVDDPHFWFDPRNYELTITDLGDALADLDPDNAEAYTANAAAYAAQMDTLFNWADEGMRSVADGQRFIVTSHDAFQYFGAAFGWQMEAIQGLSTEDEAGVGDIQSVVDFIMQNEIPVVFVESSIPPDTIEAVIEAVRSEGGDVRIGVREMYSDAMNQPDAFGGTYVGMVAENVLTILQSYACAGADVSIPAWPDGLMPQPPAEITDVDCEA